MMVDIGDKVGLKLKRGERAAASCLTVHALLCHPRSSALISPKARSYYTRFT